MNETKSRERKRRRRRRRRKKKLFDFIGDKAKCTLWNYFI
jgi:hypothetical protein